MDFHSIIYEIMCHLHLFNQSQSKATPIYHDTGCFAGMVITLLKKNAAII